VDSNDSRAAPRYPFVVDIEVIDLESRDQIKARTKNVSLFGCGIDTLKIFPKGTDVGIKLSYGNEHILAKARVIYSGQDLGMGVAFVGIEAEYERILEGWIVELSTVNLANWLS
jgi:hypothetical protein